MTRRYEVPDEPANSPRHAICSVHGIITNRSAMVFGTDTARVAVRVWSVLAVCCGNDLALGYGPGKCREVLDAIWSSSFGSHNNCARRERCNQSDRP
ncbi:hypothetical protein ACYCVF_33400 [Bradyrhizobium sp. 1.29L]